MMKKILTGLEATEQKILKLTNLMFFMENETYKAPVIKVLNIVLNTNILQNSEEGEFNPGGDIS